ncbi:cell wall-binding repeat-containing protein [Fictibacillus nanhaiensis]|uniref:cell wall-binding repeat-containing protein n=1 Tax=Fictibacillus nanhaiensis TaxID=742169 RepID=UPI001C94B41B|nr:cell wall-binding repeat-containing protein [Fictibacillus nanhaiensis]MBY6037107.1 cell wall-binding repeat-containing protein [Fictibacillus nanhaiensis]
MKLRIIGAVSCSLLTSILFTSAVSAESNPLVQNQYSTDRSSAYSTKYSLQSLQASVTYKQVIDTYTLHEYFFSTNGGQFTVSELHNGTGEIFFSIIDADTEEVIEFGDSNTFTLPAGNYLFEVEGLNEQAKQYEYSLSGSFTKQPNNSLPSLSVTKPLTHDVRLAKGSTRLDVGGSTTADALDLYVNFNNEPISLGTSFSKSLTVQPGHNTIAFNALDSNSLNAIWSVYDVVSPGIQRIGGKDRYEVSTGISKELDNKAAYGGTVIISRGDLYTDALSGGPLAAFEGAPVLLTGTKALPSTVINELNRLKPEKAIILGGTGSVSVNVENQLKSMGIQTIQRIGGKDRFAVSAGVAEQIADYADTAIIASGLNFPDALSASGMAGYMGMPILLVGTNSVPDSIQTFIKNNSNIKKFIIVGGPATVSDNVKTKISQLRNGAKIERLGGLNRYQVSINVANYGIENYGMDLSSLLIARGDVFADALSGSPLATFTGSPILLTTSTKVEGNLNNYLKQNQGKTDFMYILGGSGSITPTTEQQLSTFIK